MTETPSPRLQAPAICLRNAPNELGAWAMPSKTSAHGIDLSGELAVTHAHARTGRPERQVGSGPWAEREAARHVTSRHAADPLTFELAGLLVNTCRPAIDLFTQSR